MPVWCFYVYILVLKPAVLQTLQSRAKGDGMGSAGASSHGLPTYPGASLLAKGCFCCKLSLHAEKSGLLVVRIKIHLVFLARQQNANLHVLIFLMNLAPNAETDPLVTPLQLWLCHLTLHWLGTWGHAPLLTSPSPSQSKYLGSLDIPSSLHLLPHRREAG